MSVWQTGVRTGLRAINGRGESAVKLAGGFTGRYGSTRVCSRVELAMFRDYTCVILADCVAEPLGHEFPRSNHMASLLLFEAQFGWVFDSERMTKALDATPVSSARLQP